MNVWQWPKRLFDPNFAARFTSEQLTTLDGKATLYGVEPCFRETLHRCAVVGGLHHGELASRVQRIGLAIFRPDSIAHGVTGEILDYLAKLGIHPFFSTSISIDRNLSRELWRYQLNLASAERLQLMDLVFEASPSILALFEMHVELPVPCAVVMSDAKGSTDPAGRSGWELRSHLGSPHRVEVHLHVADEPADVVREGGIILGPQGFADAALSPATGAVSHDILGLAKRIRIGAEQQRRIDRLQNPLDEHCPAGQVHDRWQLVHELGGRCQMASASGRNIISQSGSDTWWSDAGLLDSRSDYLSSRVGWANPDRREGGHHDSVRRITGARHSETGSASAG